MNCLLREVYNWTDGQVVPTPSAYVRRPLAQIYVSSDLLEKVYEGIKKDAGAVAAANFVRLINNMKNLSRPNFAFALVRFFGSRCMQVEPVSFPYATMDERAYRDIVSTSDFVKLPFMVRHYEELPPDERMNVNVFQFQSEAA